tara:strand:- start:715 stop:1056 length:342 start_codon:yes stop_codon:yes gene_type:complete
MITIYNSHATINSTATLNAYQAKDLYGMETTAAGVATMTYLGAANHSDAGDKIALTVVSSGADDADRINRIAGMDAMVSKVNTVNKQGFVVAFSEIENVKPGGITGIAVTIDS